MKKLFSHDKYDEALFPRIGLIIEFKNQTQLLGYISSFFQDYYQGRTLDFMEELKQIGAVKTILKASFFNEPEEEYYTLDCHMLLSLLGLVEPTGTENNLQLYTIQEVAKILSVTRQSVYNLINAGYLTPLQLKGLKGQRISKLELTNYLNTHS